MYNDIINIMKHMAETINKILYQYLINKFIMQRKIRSNNHSKEDILLKNYLNIYSRYSNEVYTIQYYGSTYYIKKIILSIFTIKVL